MSFALKLRELYPRDFFEEQDLKLICAHLSRAAIQSGISRSLRSGEVIQLRRGFYVFGEKLRKESLSLFVLAGKMLCPSAISFQSALSFHGLIPEAVYSTTSAYVSAQKKAKSYSTPFGHFTYHQIPKEAFALGSEPLQRNGHTFLMSTPIKALCDLLYVSRKTDTRLSDLEEDLRLDLDEFKMQTLNQYSLKELEPLMMAYKKKNIRAFFHTLKKEWA